MMLDYELELSSSQAITATASSTKVIDMQAAKDVVPGEAVGVYARVGGVAFNNLTSLLIAIEGCDDAAGTNAVTLVSKSFALAELTANKGLPMPDLAAGSVKRFIRGRYTVTGTNPAAGALTVGLVPSPEKAKAMNSAVKF